MEFRYNFLCSIDRLFTVSIDSKFKQNCSYSDENNENEVARQIIQCNVPYPSLYWSSKSQFAKNFVMSKYYNIKIIGLLIKSPSKRMTIKEVLEHPWLENKVDKGDGDDKKNSFSIYADPNKMSSSDNMIVFIFIIF